MNRDDRAQSGARHLMRRRTVPFEEQVNEITSIQAQFSLADAERYQRVCAALATSPEPHRSVIALGYPKVYRQQCDERPSRGGRALLWSVRMIGGALALLAPWIMALAAFIRIVRRIRRSRQDREH